MENNSTKIAAIDIGTTKIVAITGYKNSDGRYEITGFGHSPSLGIKRGVVYNIEQTINSISTAIQKAGVDDTDIFNNVYVGVAGQHIRTLKNRGIVDFENQESRINQEHLDELMERMYNTAIEPGEDILHVIPQNYILDKESGVENPVGMFAKNLQANFHIVIGQKAMLNNIKNCLSSLDINVKSLILEPLASAKAVLTEHEKEMGVTLIDIGGGTTDIAVFKNNSLIHSAVIPIGGNTITKDVMQTFALMEKQAEQLKIEYGSAIQEKSQEDIIISIDGLKGREQKEFSLKELSLVIQARMEEMIHAAMFQIESSKFQGQLNAGIVITGGGSLMKNLKQLVSFISGYDVRIAYPSEYISGEFSDTINKPQYSTAIGLVMMGNEYKKDENEKITQKMNQQAAEEQEKEREKEKKKESKFFDKFKNKMTKLFDEDEEE
jgi:cell division protein FtsA